ncbi:MAG TPA: ATP-binding protein [Bryobacteraceae bacterium]|nr:ATP-binding protein [Bryobacteraceae bacterium]
MRRLNWDRGAWLLALFLLLGVLAPSGSVLWFMNDAARSQAETARRRVTEAYRGQLGMLRERVDARWRERAAALDAAATASPNEFSLPGAAGADAVVWLDERGAPVCPSLPPDPAPDAALGSPAWREAESKERSRRLDEAAEIWQSLAVSAGNPGIAARAAQGQIRCLVRAGLRSAAVTAIQRYFGGASAIRGRDLDGRLIGADEQLLALQLLPRTDPRFARLASALAATLNAYQGPSMPSGQRLFLMDELRRLAPEAASFPAYNAELLAEQFVEQERARPGDPVLEASGLRGVWKLTSPNRRVVALYRGATVESLTNGVLGGPNPPRSVRFTAAPPGTPAAGEAVAAGAMLPGWQISFALLDTGPLDEAARRRRAAYVWLGCAVIAGLLVVGVFAGQYFRRQLRLNRLKTDLLAAVSHELKTPLASMRLLVETLLADERPDAVKTREYLNLIAGENLRLTRLVENFLTFSRIERNRQRFELAETSASDIVDSALAAMGERLQAPGCQLEVELSPGLPAIYADRDALTTVLLNLLDNACKYTPAEKRIRLRAYRQNGRLAFAVEDNGVGIAPRERKRIFRRFYQVDRRLARETGGCGLGVSIVEFIVRAHGGEVTVESRPGAGSTFRVWLPCRPAAKEAGA